MLMDKKLTSQEIFVISDEPFCLYTDLKTERRIILQIIQIRWNP